MSLRNSKRDRDGKQGDDKKSDANKKPCIGVVNGGASTSSEVSTLPFTSLKSLSAESMGSTLCDPNLLRMILSFLPNALDWCAKIRTVCRALRETASLPASFKGFPLTLSRKRVNKSTVPLSTLQSVSALQLANNCDVEKLSIYLLNMVSLESIKDLKVRFYSATGSHAMLLKTLLQRVSNLKTFTIFGDFQCPDLPSTIVDLCITNNSCFTGRVFYDPLHSFPGLKHGEFTGCHYLHSQALVFLFQNLQKLVLKAVFMTPKKLNEVAQACQDAPSASPLEKLDMSYNRNFFFQEGCAELLFKTLLHLKVLNMKSCTGVKDDPEWLKAVARHCHELRSLDVSMCQKVPPEVIIEVLKQCHDMMELDISGNQLVNDAHVTAMLQIRPNLKLKADDCPLVRGDWHFL